MVPVFTSHKIVKIKANSSKNYNIVVKPENFTFFGTSGNVYQLLLHCSDNFCSLNSQTNYLHPIFQDTYDLQNFRGHGVNI